MAVFGPLTSPTLISRKILVVEKSIIFNAVTKVWKFQYFSVTEILREINFGESRSLKTA